MSKLNKFKVPTYYICSVIVIRNGIAQEVFLHTGISDKPQVKKISLPNSAEAHILLDFSTFKNSRIFNLLQDPRKRYTSFKVYSLHDIEKNFYYLSELTLDTEIFNPTVEAIATALGLNLND